MQFKAVEPSKGTGTANRISNIDQLELLTERIAHLRSGAQHNLNKKHKKNVAPLPHHLHAPFQKIQIFDARRNLCFPRIYHRQIDMEITQT